MFQCLKNPNPKHFFLVLNICNKVYSTYKCMYVGTDTCTHICIFTDINHIIVCHAYQISCHIRSLEKFSQICCNISGLSPQSHRPLGYACLHCRKQFHCEMHSSWLVHSPGGAQVVIPGFTLTRDVVNTPAHVLCCTGPVFHEDPNSIIAKVTKYANIFNKT